MCRGWAGHHSNHAWDCRKKVFFSFSSFDDDDADIWDDDAGDIDDDAGDIGNKTMKINNLSGTAGLIQSRSQRRWRPRCWMASKLLG